MHFFFPSGKCGLERQGRLCSLDLLHNSIEFLLLVNYTDIVLKHKLEEEVRKAIFFLTISFLFLIY